MTLYISENEMLERYVDNLKKASARAGEFPKTELKKRPSLFVDFVDALKVAAGSAHQLAHAQMNPKWLDTRDIIEGIVTVSQTLPVHTEADNYLWLRIRDSLDMMVISGRKLATSRAMLRPDVLAHLDVRAKNADKLQ
jgi:hypothetical protein